MRTPISGTGIIKQTFLVAIQLEIILIYNNYNCIRKKKHFIKGVVHP